VQVCGIDFAVVVEVALWTICTCTSAEAHAYYGEYQSDSHHTGSLLAE